MTLPNKEEKTYKAKMIDKVLDKYFPMTKPVVEEVKPIIPQYKPKAWR